MCLVCDIYPKKILPGELTSTIFPNSVPISMFRIIFPTYEVHSTIISPGYQVPKSARNLCAQKINDAQTKQVNITVIHYFRCLYYLSCINSIGVNFKILNTFFILLPHNFCQLPLSPCYTGWYTDAVVVILISCPFLWLVHHPCRFRHHQSCIWYASFVGHWLAGCRSLVWIWSLLFLWERDVGHRSEFIITLSSPFLPTSPYLWFSPNLFMNPILYRLLFLCAPPPGNYQYQIQEG